MSGLIVPAGMQPHPEGGSYLETWRSPVVVATPRGPRASATAIAYLLQPGESSAWHRVRGAGELWVWQGGGALLLQTGGDGDRPRFADQIRLGPGGQLLIAPDRWQRAEPEAEAVLVACVVSPGFEFADLELERADAEPDSLPTLPTQPTQPPAGDGPLRVLLVCEGNVHRSPMAAALLRARLDAVGVHGDDVVVASAGVRTEPGLRLQSYAVRALAERGVTAGDRHRSRPLTPAIAAGADLVLAATTALRDRAVEQAPAIRDRAFAWEELLALTAGTGEPAALDGGSVRGRLAQLLTSARQQRGLVRPDTPDGFDVADPIGRRQPAFSQLAVELDTAMTALAARLIPVVGAEDTGAT